ncbi:hypothetical protein MGSAQ_000621 [marine sediment metagenome]|uniref:Uncharacterized protein n=1 Tax=marine sediment metagenome TaxID=412755 RepID=A0A1B6NWQ7_9ZZZZ
MPMPKDTSVTSEPSRQMRALPKGTVKSSIAGTSNERP